MTGLIGGRWRHIKEGKKRFDSISLITSNLSSGLVPMSSASNGLGLGV